MIGESLSSLGVIIFIAIRRCIQDRLKRKFSDPNFVEEEELDPGKN